jgi:hypothetical protein
MTKLNQLTQPFARSQNVNVEQAVLEASPERFRNLIVLVSAQADCTSVPRRICSLAKETNSCIQLLGIYKNTSEELALRRELAMAAALIRDARFYVEIVVERGNDWVEAVRHSYQSGDMIVCVAEQSLSMQRKPLSQILELNFKTPVRVLTKTSVEQSEPSVLSKVTAWSGLLGVIGIFFLLQVRVIQVASGGFQTLLLIMLLVPELWLVKVWNSLFF